MHAGSSLIRGRSCTGNRTPRRSTQVTREILPRIRNKTELDVKKPIARSIAAGFISAVIFAVASAQEQQPGIKRLDDSTRAKVLAALAGLIILGFAMVLLTWLGARITQRYRNSSAVFKPTPRPGEHEWARKPLHGEEPDSN